ncbi:chemotaxis-specific protein-glutamate methyltransferase CheB [bacterium]|nr:chemotaxis-specific protein-glutamate methyltransferase CheB [bacterium]
MRVAIVNDAPLAREVLKRVILSTPNHSVAWLAEDGADAVRKAHQDPPDIILMDLVMPVMDGVEATRRIMAEKPCPILLVTSSVTGNFNLVYRAMGNGGLDAVNTPTLGAGGVIQGAEGILARLTKLSKTSEKTQAIASSSSSISAHEIDLNLVPIIAIGASTGGPSAIAQVLTSLPKNLGASVIIAQHIAADFAPSLAKWLEDSAGRTVRVARPGDSPTAGVVLLASTNDHLVIRADRKVGYESEPANYPYRPSVDVLFESLARHYPQPGVAVLLTGMGSDGARGLLMLRQRGWHTIAQNEATSIVYGMPKSAAEMKAAIEILPIQGIAAAIASKIK